MCCVLFHITWGLTSPGDRACDGESSHHGLWLRVRWLDDDSTGFDVQQGVVTCGLVRCSSSHTNPCSHVPMRCTVCCGQAAECTGRGSQGGGEEEDDEEETGDPFLSNPVFQRKKAIIKKECDAEGFDRDIFKSMVPSHPPAAPLH